MKPDKYILLALVIGCCCFYSRSIWAQDQRIADSLASIYKANSLVGEEKMELLRELAYNENKDKLLAIQYAEELIELASEEEHPLYLYRGFMQLGNANLVLGNFQLAQQAFFSCLDAARAAEIIPAEGTAYMSIADVYSLMDDKQNAELYYNKAIDLLRDTDETLSLARTLYNTGDHYLQIGEYKKALALFEECGPLFEEIDDLIGSAYTKGNMGKIFLEQENFPKAKASLTEAITLLEQTGDNYALSAYLIPYSEVFRVEGNVQSAMNYALRSLDLATEAGYKDEMSEANLQLYQLHMDSGNFAVALKYYKDHIALRDSIKNIATVQEVANLRYTNDIAQKQAEVDLLNQQKRNQLIMVIATGVGFVMLVLLTISMYRRNRFMQKTKKIIEEEQDRSEHLLLNILPKGTAEELKEKGRVKAQKFESVTVLFTDFKSFTQFAETLDPEVLVESMDFYYSKFDAIIEKYGLEKIKTVGDAYMCAGGLPIPTEDHAYKMVQAALEITRFVEHAKKHNPDNKTRFDIRIGVNSGPVVAGVVGTKKFAYDIWGDTVNIAARMETKSGTGKVNVGEATYELIKDDFECEFRGHIPAKNKGKLRMYYVHGLKKKSKKSKEAKPAMA